MNKIYIIVDDNIWSKHLGFDEWNILLPKVFDKIVSMKKCRNCSVNLLLTNDMNIQKLNNKFRYKNVPTNVLSFPQYNPKDKELGIGNINLGDIAMSFETIRTESIQFCIDLFNRCTHLFVHGVLHLFGMDHIKEDDRLKMETLEVEILNFFGIKNPYILEK